MHLKEFCESIKILLDAIQWNEFEWYLWGDLMIIGILMGLVMQGGFAKNYCFLCLWDSRATTNTV